MWESHIIIFFPVFQLLPYPPAPYPTKFIFSILKTNETQHKKWSLFCVGQLLLGMKSTVECG